MRPVPHPGVLAWVGTQRRALLSTTYINQIEVLYGIAAMPDGRRRTALTHAARAIFEEYLSGHVLSFGAGAADCYVDIVMARQRAGNPIESFDALIAATAMAAGASVATRDVGGFRRCGLTVIDPWFLE